MYQALYRKYRPASFDDVISQQHITETLKREIVSGKTAHAYIFTGSRGTGKTTCARILAKALICENTVNGEPCLECDNCRDMDREQLADIIEIDAASNNGVEDARDLKEAAYFTPDRCRYRIYIIDEVHMLSPQAFNALLKLIEEPPPHAKFIMATTEIHKVLPTILSRCQRFDFRRIRPADIADRLMYVAEKEGFSLDREAAEIIAGTADGAMRDALSLLDRCLALSDNITEKEALEATGAAGSAAVLEMTAALLSKDTEKALKIISDVYAMSKDMTHFLTEIMGQLRNILVILNVKSPDSLLNCMPADAERLKNMAENADEEQAVLALDELGRRLERFSHISDKRTELEMTAIRICKGNMGKPAAVDPALAGKVAALENMLNSMNAAQYAQAAPARHSRDRILPREAVTDTSGTAGTEARLLPQWADILERFGEVCPSMKGTLHGSRAYEAGEALCIETENSFFMELLRVKDNALLLMKTIAEVTGRNYRLRARCTSANAKITENNGEKLDALLKKAAEGNIPVENE